MAQGANQTGKVIHDYETREYREGWNANNKGANYLSNPYSALAYDGELYRLWQKGFNDNHAVWDSPEKVIPQPYNKYEVSNSFSITDNHDN